MKGQQLILEDWEMCMLSVFLCGWEKRSRQTSLGLATSQYRILYLAAVDIFILPGEICLVWESERQVGEGFKVGLG